MNAMNLLDSKESVKGREIYDWCMNNQDNPLSQILYAKYFSQNSPRRADWNGYYFIRKDVMVEGELRPITLKRDRSKIPNLQAKIWEIPMDKKSEYKGSITIVSYRDPMEVYKIMKLKNYRRNVKAEPIRLFMNSYCPGAICVGETDIEMPNDRLFLLLKKDIREVE